MSVARRAARLGVLAAGGYLFIVLVMMFLERQMLFFPARYPDGWWSTQGLDIEEVKFESVDGTQLFGWYAPCPEPKAVMLVANGNAGNLTQWVTELPAWRNRHRLCVMLFDYRGYGRSEGKPDETGILADARAARAWLANRAGIDESQVVLFGRSLGGAVMVDLAAEKGARGLILESTFSSLPDVAAHHYPWLPVRWCMRTRLDSISKIGRYRGPLLQFHSRADEVVPYELGVRLFEQANKPKKLVTAERGDHNDVPSAEYERAFGKFIEELP